VRRLVWTAIGAAGGIWAYRKGSELLEQAREQGVALTIQQVALSATQTVNQVSNSINERTAHKPTSQKRPPNPRTDNSDNATGDN
jgi:hypothetical protein